MIEKIKALWSKFKTIIIYTTIVAFIFGGLGFYISEKTRPIPKVPEIHQNITPEVHGDTKKPTTPQEMNEAANAEIEVTRELKDGIYSGLATNGFKFTRWQDKIIIPMINPKWMIQADFYAGIIDKKTFYMYGASGNYFYNDRVYFGGGGAGSNYGGMIKINAGMAFY